MNNYDSASPDARRAAILKKLREEDSILESSARKSYEEFKSLGGDPQEAQLAMIESFKGQAAVANTLCSWIQFVGGDPDAIVERVTGAQFQNFQVTTADKVYMKMEAEEADDDNDNESGTEFLSTVSRMDKWWSHLEKLRREHAGSALLEFLHTNRGLTGPIVAGARTPERCVAFIKKCIEGLMSKSVLQDSDIKAFYDVAKDAAAYDELTLVIWLSTLNEIAKEVEDGAFKSLLRRCAQEIRFAAVRRAVNTINTTEYDAQCFVTRLGQLIDVNSAGSSVPPEHIGNLWTLVSVDPKAATGIDTRKKSKEALDQIKALYAPLRPRVDVGDEAAVKEVSPIADENRLSYLELLARPEVMTCIWKKLFVQSVRAPKVVNKKADADEDVRNCLCMLMALATVYLRHRNEPSSAALPLEKQSERDEARKLEDNLIECVSVCEYLFTGCRQRPFDTEVEKAVLRRRSTCEAGPEPLTCKMRLLNGVSESSVIAYGIIMWAREGLLKNVVPEHLLKTCVSYLELLEAVAEKYVFWRDEILELYADAYAHQIWERTSLLRDINIESKLRSMYGSALVSMVRLRCATRVVDLYRTRFAEDTTLIDKAQVRTFVCHLVAIIQGECSPRFATALLQLLNCPTVLNVLTMDSVQKPTQAVQGSIIAARKDVHRILAGIPKLATPEIDRELGLPQGTTLLSKVKKDYGVPESIVVG